MGYGYYLLPDGREAGYTVEAICDADGCKIEIDRGMGYLCGRAPDGHRDPDEPGCGEYHCEHHKHNHDCPKQECGVYPCTDCEMSVEPCWLLVGHTGKHADEGGFIFAISEESCEELRRMRWTKEALGIVLTREQSVLVQAFLDSVKAEDDD